MMKLQNQMINNPHNMNMNPHNLNPQIMNNMNMNPQNMNNMNMNPQNMNNMNMNPQIMNNMNMNPQIMNNMNMNPQIMNNMNMNPQIMNNMNINPQIMNNMNINPQIMNNMMNYMKMLIMNNINQAGMVMGGNDMSKMNQMMGINSLQMGMGMNPMMMVNMNMMTPEQKNKYKQWQRYMGYLYGKKMAQEKKKKEQALNPQNNVSNPSECSTNNDGEITVEFNKAGTITKIKMDSKEMVADLINEFFLKTNTNNGTFKFNDQTLSPSDFNSLKDIGLRDGSKITVI